MKLEEAYLIVEAYEKVENQEGMSARVAEAVRCLEVDINIIRDIVQHNKKIIITWKNDLTSDKYKELMKNYYELADGSSRLLNKRKKYDLNPNGPIAKVLIKEDPKIANDNEIRLAIKNIANYNEVYQKIKKLSEWIRGYNKMGFKLNIPSMEFKIPLKEIYNDYKINDKNNGTNQRN